MNSASLLKGEILDSCIHAGGRIFLFAASLFYFTALNLSAAEHLDDAPPLISIDASWAIQAPMNDSLLRWSAEDLQEKFLKISGHRVPIISADDTATAVGKRPTLFLELLQPFDADLGESGFWLRINDKAVKIQGNTPLGICFGAMELLERLGCRWYAPNAYKIPENRSLSLTAGASFSVPAFSGRQVSSFSSMDPEWCLRNRLNSGYYFPALENKSPFYGNDGHSFAQLIPPLLFAEHPEYFSEVAGRRKRDGQLCLTNFEVADRIRKGIFEAIIEAPEATAFHVSQNDNMWWCECPDCSAMARRYGGRAGLLVHFLNPLAEQIAVRFPHKRIATLAYTYTQPPPEEIVPHPNLLIRFCNYRPHCQIHALQACHQNRRNYEDLAGWAKQTKNLHVYEYMINFFRYPVPCPNLEAIAENIRLYQKAGVKGIYYSGLRRHGVWMAELKSYLTARWLWDPDRKYDVMVEEFLTGYFGPYAKTVQQILALSEQTATRADIHPDLYGFGSENVWGPEYVAQLGQILKAAENMGESGPFASRLLPLKLSLAYLRGVNGPRSPKDLEDFRKLAAAIPVEYLGPDLHVEDFLAALGAMLPEAGIVLKAGDQAACKIIPDFGGLIAGLRMGKQTCFEKQTEDPLQFEGIRWLLNPEDTMKRVPLKVKTVEKDSVTLFRSLGNAKKRCRAELYYKLRQDPLVLALELRLQNLSAQPRQIPIILGIVKGEEPQIFFDSLPCSIPDTHPLKKALIRIKDGRKVVSIQYLKTMTEFSLVSELQPKSLVIPPEPGEGKTLEVRYGATTLEVGEEKRYNFWIFPKSLKVE